MYLSMGRSLTFGTLNGIEIDGSDLTDTLAEWELEHHWLVHIVPDATDTHIHERFLHVTPPLTYLRPRVIGEDRIIRPDITVKHCPVGSADEHVALHPCLVDPVIGIDL